jgi:ubiquinone/menaquinone biosynthesis C-methylase UbiE
VNVSGADENTAYSSTDDGAPRDAQGDVNAYFDSTASYWDGVYRGDDLQGLIYQRRQDVVLAYVDAAQRRPQARTLEIGCGAGHLTVNLAQRDFLVDAVDASDAMVDAAAQRVRDAGIDGQVTVRKADVHELPFPSDHFDLVVAVGVIPWLHSPSAGVAEMARVLRPNGQLVVTADNRTRLTSFTDPRRILGLTPLRRLYRALRKPGSRVTSRLHSPRSIDRMLTKAGLRPLARQTVGFGPLSFMGRSIFAGSAGLRVDERLQAIADRRVPGLRWTGWHYVVRAGKL